MCKAADEWLGKHSLQLHGIQSQFVFSAGLKGMQGWVIISLHCNEKMIVTNTPLQKSKGKNICNLTFILPMLHQYIQFDIPVQYPNALLPISLQVTSTYTENEFFRKVKRTNKNGSKKVY